MSASRHKKTIYVPTFRCDVNGYDIEYVEFTLKRKSEYVQQLIRAWDKKTGEPENIVLRTSAKKAAALIRDTIMKVDKLLDVAKYLVAFPVKDSDFGAGADRRDIEKIRAVQAEIGRAGIDTLAVQELLEHRRLLSVARRVFEQETGRKVVDSLAASFAAQQRQSRKDIKAGDGTWEPEDVFDFAIRTYNETAWSDMQAMPDAARKEDETTHIATKALYRHTTRHFLQN